SPRRGHAGSTLFPYTTLFRSVLGIAALVVAPALAQQSQRGRGQFGRGGFGGGPGMLIGNEGVQKELKLDSGQVEKATAAVQQVRSEEHTSELQSRENLVCRLL